MPTQAVLPSATPAPTSTSTPTIVPTETPIPTLTPDLGATQVAMLQATNAAAQVTLDALLTRVAATESTESALTPTRTLTHTPVPTVSLPQAVPMQPRLFYALRLADLRSCPSQSCALMARLQTGEAVIATGTIQGEALTSGNPHWFRVDYNGQELYVHSALVDVNPLANPPVSVPPTTASGFVPPPSGSVSCPDLSATCSQLTCDQAYACLAAGNGGLDRDGDGIPCESVCA